MYTSTKNEVDKCPKIERTMKLNLALATHKVVFWQVKNGSHKIAAEENKVKESIPS
jgi:hypothetical protein